MAIRECVECGIHFEQLSGRAAKRCPTHRSRYGSAHQKIRSATIAGAYGKPCTRCGEIMFAGDDLHLDHDEHGGYRGYSHAYCNTRAGAIKGNALRAGRYAADGRPPKPPKPHPRAAVVWDSANRCWGICSRHWG